MGLVAQRLEQRTHNPLVPGSNPGGPTIWLTIFANANAIQAFHTEAVRSASRVLA